MEPIALKVGDIAKQSGVSIRTLHYYDEIGLLSPSYRTEAGYRLYDKEDIIRLQQIVSLKQIGLSLEEIRDCLQQGEKTFFEIVQLHQARVREEIRLSQKILEKLEYIQEATQSRANVSISDLLKIIKVIEMLEKYYTPEQLENLKERRNLLDEEQMRQSEAHWIELIDAVRQEMQKGTDPASKNVQGLVHRRQELIDEFTGGDPEIERSLNEMYDSEGAEVASWGEEDAALAEYMSRAIQCSTEM